MERKPRILISGGGTGGHIFPALSIADACRRRFDAEILFVGAEGRMEMERVAAAGYKIIGLPVAGFDRKHLLRNIKVLQKLRKSLKMARQIIRDFKPDVAIGVGGYASGPVLKAAQKAGIPTLIQEQNSYAGVTNKLLARGAKAICVAYHGMDRFFPADRIVETGNPVRQQLLNRDVTPGDGRLHFGLEPGRKTILTVGGSLGALTLNETMEKIAKPLAEKGCQIIWQTGKSRGGEEYWRRKTIEDQHFGELGKRVAISTFISDMDRAYAAADLVVARAGAGTISELELLGKPCILVPSPNVAEDHQTKNAQALASQGAAVMVADADCRESLLPAILSLIDDEGRLEAMSRAISAMAMPESDEKIADEIAKILNCR